MSAKGGVGMRIDLDKVPTRQKNMKAWELLLSESQERMLIVVEKGKEKMVTSVFEKWDLPCSNIGEVTGDGLLRFFMHGQLEAEIPAHELVLGGGAPQYTREYKEPAYLEKVNAFSQDNIADIVNDQLQEVAEQIIQLPNIANKRWVYIQYDSMVGAANASTNMPADAAVVLSKDAGKALAMTVDCNSRYVFADPYKGAMIAVAEAARNIVCSGGEPIGVTNCLNFGNPYDPEVYYQFIKAVEGMGDACRKFNTPVTGGNVSFYNQSASGGPVYPTPTIGMVGVIDYVNDHMTMDYKNVGDIIMLIGEQQEDIASSEYLHKIRGVEYSPAPHFDLDEEYAMQVFVASLIMEKTIKSAHDVSEGGLMITLFEKGFNRNLGFDVSMNSDIRTDAFWFGEAQSRAVISCNQDQADIIKHRAASAGIPVTVLGTVTKGAVTVNGENWGHIGEWKFKYDTAIEQLLVQ
jgi:phosphoribosylformylglycinamidine synthase